MHFDSLGLLDIDVTATNLTSKFGASTKISSSVTLNINTSISLDVHANISFNTSFNIRVDSTNIIYSAGGGPGRDKVPLRNRCLFALSFFRKSRNDTLSLMIGL